jgi:hypothetical protein
MRQLPWLTRGWCRPRTALPLLRRQRRDLRLRGEKGVERLRTWCPICRESSGLLPTRRYITEDGPHPAIKVEPTAQPNTGVNLGGRATSVPFTAVLIGT